MGNLKRTIALGIRDVSPKDLEISPGKVDDGWYSGIGGKEKKKK